MGRLRHYLKNLERQTRGKEIRIVQKDGSIARFPESALAEAFVINMRRLREEDVEPHALTRALQNAKYHEPWHDSYADAFEIVGGEPLEDLSE